MAVNARQPYVVEVDVMAEKVMAMMMAMLYSIRFE